MEKDVYCFDKYCEVCIVKVRNNPHPVHYMVFREGSMISNIDRAVLLYLISKWLYDKLKAIVKLKEEGEERRLGAKPFLHKDKNGELKIVKCSGCHEEIRGNFIIPANTYDFEAYCEGCCKKRGIRFREWRR